MRGLYAVLVLVLAVGTGGQAWGQTGGPGSDPPGGGCADPSLKIKEGPTPNALHQVTTKFEWKNCTGIAKIEVKMFKKDTDGNYTVSIGSETYNTTVTEGTTINKLFPDPAQAANTKIKIVVTAKDGTGTVIKSDEGTATLP